MCCKGRKLSNPRICVSTKSPLGREAEEALLYRMTNVKKDTSEVRYEGGDEEEKFLYNGDVTVSGKSERANYAKRKQSCGLKEEGTPRKRCKFVSVTFCAVDLMH